jgi:bacterial/archaeal transporter family-2 protein
VQELLLQGVLVLVEQRDGDRPDVGAAANLQLTKAVGASTLQLWVAAGLLLVLAVLVGALGALAGVVDVPAWYLLGGLASPLYITSGILLFPRLGALAAAGCSSPGRCWLVLATLLVLRRTRRPTLPTTDMPWWGWLGGLCAAAYVTGTFLLVPVIGAAVTVALTVTGQQLASAVVDARGWFRLPRQPFTAVRGGGLLFLVAGSLLVQLT